MAEDASKKVYFHLAQLSTEELETILRASALSENIDNLDLVDYILEVIVLREQEKNNALDIEQARKDFDQYYRDLDTPLYPSTNNEADVAKPKVSHFSMPQKKQHHIKHALFVAAVIAVLITLTCIPVLGHNNIIQLVAGWTAEQFGFFLPEQPTPYTSTERSSFAQVPQEYQELQIIMQQFGATLLIPKIPEEFEAGEPMLSYSSEDSALEFMLIYQKESEYYIFGVDWNSDLVTNRYEKDKTLVEILLYDNIKHYVLSNTDNNTVVWYTGNMYYIISNRSTSDLKVILESMYEVKQ